MDGRFAGKVALVTGGSSGIGQAAATLLAREGAVVAVNHRPDVDATETVRTIRDAGGDAFAVAADMRDPSQVAGMISSVADTGGRLDYLVSNAGINPIRSWDDMSVEDFDALSETNFRGTWLVCTEAAKQMIRENHGGAICCTSSISAHVGSPWQVAYCGTKGAVSMLAKALGAVLGEHGIRVNAVEPGLIDTPMADVLKSYPQALEYYRERTPLRRIGQPEDVAKAIAFLLSDDSGFVTSSTLLVDGGFIVNAEK